jgi:hypothetical protein
MTHFIYRSLMFAQKEATVYFQRLSVTYKELRQWLV